MARGWLVVQREARRASEVLVVCPRSGSAAPSAPGRGGDIRRRLALDGAEEAFAKAEALDSRPFAGLALLRLAQGRVEARRPGDHRRLGG